MVPSSFMISQMTPAGIEARQARQVHAGFGLAGAHQHAAVACAQRENVPGAGQVAGLAARVDGSQDGAGAVRRGDAGGDALARVDGLAEGGAEVGGVLRGHQRQAQVVAAGGGKAQADQAAPVRRHEIDDFRRDFLGRDGEIAFVLAVLVVNHHQDASGADLLNGFGNGREGHIPLDYSGLRAADRLRCLRSLPYTHRPRWSAQHRHVSGGVCTIPMLCTGLPCSPAFSPPSPRPR